jgi:hypothetical protein
MLCKWSPRAYISAARKTDERIKMQVLGTWEGDALMSQVLHDGRVLQMIGRGVLTLPAFYEATAFAAGLAVNLPYEAVVFDFSKTLIAIGEADMKIIRPAKKTLSGHRPAAFVVPDAFREPFQVLSWHSAQMGLERAAFIDLREAMAWAHRRVNQIERRSTPRKLPQPSAWKPRQRDQLQPTPAPDPEKQAV